MRIATYNVEWFSNLFDTTDHLLMDDGWSGRQDVTRAQQIEALGIVFTAVDADAWMIIEAPDQNGKHSTEMALENFAAAFELHASKALLGFGNDTQQEIALLYDPKKLRARHDPQGVEIGQKGAADTPRFDGVFRIDLDVDATQDTVRFSKPPLEVALTTDKGNDLRLIGAHLKSKAPHGARGRDAVMRLSIANRRKQLAQAIWLRQRVEQHLDQGDPLILLGDLNDGPGLDEYENLFGRSSVEIVMGEEGENCLFDPHARQAARARFGPQATTSRFYLSKKKKYIQALLDYIMVSPDLRSKNPQWRIWHPFDDPDCFSIPELRGALLTASDHFPVVLDVDV
ncbi:Endonuclease/Exonuclease/phosphatase family protein [Shimia gijangensis]|uniref:Endonuclease/Exonuclease/phosphatase family protein n=1 Tax=Shimia gijangensis TaxID=1470563 RepID=A0A1M6P069_9RHOB|nr:endonuclease/exonuclease/phosphatase family protein [Shimia gijangensis]SHK01293.1 Endonuclease/Exonuclease/phosphatase family protein [Shimia gijangensis]